MLKEHPQRARGCYTAAVELGRKLSKEGWGEEADDIIHD